MTFQDSRSRLGWIRIGEGYKSIVSIDLQDDPLAQKALDEYDNLYHKYIALYNLVMEPSGGLTDFVKELDDYISDIETGSKTLQTLLSS